MNEIVKEIETAILKWEEEIKKPPQLKTYSKEELNEFYNKITEPLKLEEESDESSN